MLLSNLILFHQLCLGLIDPQTKYNPPKDAAMKVMRYSTMLVEHMWTMDREYARVCPSIWFCNLLQN